MSFKQYSVILLLAIHSYITLESFNYAYFAIEAGVESTSTVMVLGALWAPTTALLGYAFKLLKQES